MSEIFQLCTEATDLPRMKWSTCMHPARLLSSPLRCLCIDLQVLLWRRYSWRLATHQSSCIRKREGLECVPCKCPKGDILIDRRILRSLRPNYHDYITTSEHAVLHFELHNVLMKAHTSIVLKTSFWESITVCAIIIINYIVIVWQAEDTTSICYQWLANCNELLVVVVVLWFLWWCGKDKDGTRDDVMMNCMKN